MPDIGYFHPQLVHFAVVLGVIGVALRLLSLTGKLGWTHQAARWILIAAGVVGFLTAKSGDQAHGPVERIPGAAHAVEEHEEWGERARNALLLVAGLELIGIAVGTRKGAGAVKAVSAAAGLWAVFALYEAGEHGGELVYEYAGGPGIRSGDTTDVTRLLVAGLYNRAIADRAAGDKEGAARLIDELVRRMPNDRGAVLAGIESQIKDRGDPAGAIAALHAFDPGDDRRSKFRRVTLLADAFKATGSIDSARAVLESYKRDNPTSAARVDAILETLK